jgi:hypothetical protein
LCLSAFQNKLQRVQAGLVSISDLTGASSFKFNISERAQVRLPNVAVSGPTFGRTDAGCRRLYRILREPPRNLRQIHGRQYEACHEDDR